MTVLSAKKGRACNGVCMSPVAALPFFLFLLVSAFPIGAQIISTLPAIPVLESRDITFRQYLADVEAARRILYSSRQTLADRAEAEEISSRLTIYTYIPSASDELLAIAARCNIPYGTLASLNRLSHTEEMVPGKTLLLPSIPGIFIPQTPETSLERLLFSARVDAGPGVLLSIPRGGKTERFRFLPGDDFTSTERVFFLNRGFQFPLQNFQLSSSYGPRTNPVTGVQSMHGGLDLAAPEGTNVYAVKNGTVADIGEDSVLGKYIIISHDDNWISFYGHLSEITVGLRANVQSASLIAKVGSTGQSTGPHLHFELRQNGQSRDPARLLGLFKGITR